MNPPSRGEVTRLLIAWSNGDREAFDKLAQALFAGHYEGVVHRDLKPGNVKCVQIKVE